MVPAAGKLYGSKAICIEFGKTFNSIFSILRLILHRTNVICVFIMNMVTLDS